MAFGARKFRGIGTGVNALRHCARVLPVTELFSWSVTSPITAGRQARHLFGIADQAAWHHRVIDVAAAAALPLTSSGGSEQELAVRLSLLIVVAFAAAVCIANYAAAQTDAWCAYYDLGKDGFRSCRFATLQQCLEDVRGIGGNCSPSPYPSSPALSTKRSKRHHHY
jgi:hypothetical protein